ncbi:MAG TPA: host-nuclease inhibitor Gam family protein [Accumulibacter sp.]|uniref:host-nuclease inhibitor Gam family protein n=1 Tax=Accumulibacter sp. TaxID=2053492 RepID=UPI0025FF043B|nr:host-nuclease inhibitor Gam family protein [Accumulibacter sp.]MCM8599936.1 host-nuclease inhibitor Gam family protein [Accumulibacter sp.]MCM8664120.1 host-nuclease inhibitor Gam family protein [Accumulibacter sp.]HNC51224.1 host-nuclease inhibitor Gam family protein [Accumulibacter sp.]
MNPKRTRFKTVAAPTVPQTREEVAELIAGIGIDNRELTMMEVEMNNALARIKEDYEQRAEPARRRIEAAQRGVQAFCEANRQELTANGKVKTHQFTTGEVQWRTRPPSVRITGEESVMFSLRALGLLRFLRVKEEINREAILNEPSAVAGVPGIRISQIEDFVVTPFEVELSAREAS